MEGTQGPLKFPRQPKLSRDGLVLVLVFGSMVVAGLSMVQGRTIESQRNMIRTLFVDSKELNALKLQQHVATPVNPEPQQKADTKDSCSDKSGKNCGKGAAAAPSKRLPDTTPVPENSDDALPNPQRMLHSI